jgi:hypothetical protein
MLIGDRTERDDLLRTTVVQEGKVVAAKPRNRPPSLVRYRYIQADESLQLNGRARRIPVNNWFGRRNRSRRHRRLVLLREDERR